MYPFMTPLKTTIRERFAYLKHRSQTPQKSVLLHLWCFARAGQTHRFPFSESQSQMIGTLISLQSDIESPRRSMGHPLSLVCLVASTGRCTVPSIQLRIVHIVDCCSCIVPFFKLDESESSMLPCRVIQWYVHVLQCEYPLLKQTSTGHTLHARMSGEETTRTFISPKGMNTEWRTASFTFSSSPPT
jgi:hypothetical protein